MALGRKSLYLLQALLVLTSIGFLKNVKGQDTSGQFNYTQYSRLTDPGENKYLIDELPDDISEICDIANVQLVHYRMLSQMKIPKNKWHTKFANHDLKNILDTLKNSGNGKLTKERDLQNRIIGACTKESIFSTGILRSKDVPARMRVGFLTNLYTSPNSLGFWKNVKEYELRDTTGIYPDKFTLNAIKVNRAIEHWVTEFYDENARDWKLLDIRPEYLNAYGKNVDYFLTVNEDFEFGWQVWKRINEKDFEESAYDEGDLDAKSHVRYQMLMDFYSLLNYDCPGVFDSNGKFIGDTEMKTSNS